MKKILIALILILAISFVTIYSFNLFNLRDILNGNNVIKTDKDNVQTTIVKGSKLSLPPEFINSSITVYDSSAIVEKKIQVDSANSTSSYTIIMKNSTLPSDLMKFYEDTYQEKFMDNKDNKILITGDTMLIIKIIMSAETHEITITKR